MTEHLYRWIDAVRHPLRGQGVRRRATAMVSLLAAAGGLGAAAIGTAAGAATTAPGGSLAANAASVPDGTLTGVGASSIQLFYQKLFYVYGQQHKGLSINYAPSGSGPGVTAIEQNTANFGQSEIPMTVTQQAAAKGVVLQVPVDLGGVAIAYHLSGVKAGLHLDGPTLAKIYLRQITTWNDPAIAKLNPHVHLPAENIVPVYRADTSGPGYDLDQYLIDTVGAGWTTRTGSATASTTWPTAGRPSGTTGQQLNAGVASYIQQTEGAIGYVEYAYTLAAHMTDAAVKSRAGTFVPPSVTSIKAAGSNAIDLSPGNFDIVNSAGSKTYPLANFSWALVYQQQSNLNTAIDLGKVFAWVISTGQSYSKALGYAPLPPNAVAVARAALLNLETTSGQAVFSG